MEHDPDMMNMMQTTEQETKKPTQKQESPIAKGRGAKRRVWRGSPREDRTGLEKGAPHDFGELGQDRLQEAVRRRQMNIFK